MDFICTKLRAVKFYRKQWRTSIIGLIKKYYAEKKNLVFFDVGANIGDYSEEVLKKFSSQVILYAFEPAKATFEQLNINLSSYNNIVFCNVGLGDSSGEFVLYSNDQSSGQSSLYKRNMGHWSNETSLGKEEQVDIVNPIEFCKTHKIEHIHFIKLDVEGNELSILQSMEPMLAHQKIDFIQFEFGVCNVDSKVFFKDFYYLLNSHYDLFRIVKDGVYPVSRYHEIYEVFMTVNYLAVSNRISKAFNKIT